VQVLLPLLVGAALVLTVRIERTFWAHLLAEREREHAETVKGLLNRIQAPKEAPFIEIAPDDRKQFVSEADENARFEAEFGEA
jgi:hypothetical protein